MGDVGLSDSALTLVRRPMWKFEGGTKAEAGAMSPSVVSLPVILPFREAGWISTVGAAPKGFELAKGMAVSDVDVEIEGTAREEAAPAAAEEEGTDPGSGAPLKLALALDEAAVNRRSSRSLL